MQPYQVAQLANILMEQYGLIDQGWTFGFNRHKRSLGLCRYDIREISLSQYHLDRSDESIKDTILHEIAHALTPGHGHDYVWRRMCLSIGGNGERCGSSDVEIQYTWKGVCPTCKQPGSKQHRAPLRVKACGKCCGRKYNTQHAFIWYKHGKRVPTSAMPQRYRMEALRLGVA